jgi:hypothetical protein
MPSSIDKRLSSVQPQMLRVDGEGDPQRLGTRGETDPQAVGKRAMGRVIETALARASLTKQEAAYAMGYSDAGVIGRWLQGTETPQFAKLWTLGDPFRRELVIALAELAGQAVEVTTQITVRRA